MWLQTEEADSRQQKWRFRSALRPCVLSDPSGVSWDQLKVDGAQQLKFQEPRSSRRKGWGFIYPNIGINYQFRCCEAPFFASWRHFRKARVYLPSLAVVSDSSPCLEALLDNLLRMAVLEQRDWMGEFQTVSSNINDTVVSAGNKFQFCSAKIPWQWFSLIHLRMFRNFIPHEMLFASLGQISTCGKYESFHGRPGGTPSPSQVHWGLTFEWLTSQ